jgi:hypothetical protein
MLRSLRNHAATLSVILAVAMSLGGRDTGAAGEVAPANDAALNEMVERAEGLVTDHFALIQGLTLEEFQAVADRLGGAGFRPLKVRPYRASGVARVASVWIKDPREWRVKVEATAEEIVAAVGALKAEQFLPIDVAGYATVSEGKECDRYAAAWVKQGGEDEVEALVGVTIGAFPEDADRLKAAGLGIATLHRHRAADGVIRFSSVWSKSAGDVGWAYNYGDRWFFDGEAEKQAWEYNIADLVPNPILRADRSALLRSRVESNDRVLEADPADLPAHYSRGVDRYWLGDYAGAVDDLTAVIREDPGFSRFRSYYYRALARARLGPQDGILEDYQEYTKQTSVLAEHTALLALITACIGAEGRGEELLDNAVRTSRGDSVVEYYTAHAFAGLADLVRDRDPEAARRFTGKAVQLLEHPLEVATQAVAEADLITEFWPIRDDPGFLALLSKHQLDRQYAGVWHRRRTTDAKAVHAPTTAEHLRHAREAAAQGFVPVSVSVVEIGPGELPVADSVWSRPLPPEAVEAEALARQAEGAISRGEPGEAAAPLERAYTLRRDALSEGHRDTIRAARSLGRLHTKDLGDTAGGERWLRAWLEGAKAGLGERHESTLEAHDELARVLERRATGQFDSDAFEAAAAGWKEAAAHRTARYGADDWRVRYDVVREQDARRFAAFDEPTRLRVKEARGALARARALDKDGDDFGAVPLVEGAAGTLAEILGPDHRFHADALALLARLVNLRGDTPRTEELVRRVLAIYETTYGTNDPDYGRASKALGQFAESQDRLDEAAERFRKASTILRGAWGKDDDEYAEARGQLASVLATLAARREQAGDLDGAVRFHLERRELLGDQYGYRDWHVWDVDDQVASLRRRARLDDGDRAKLRQADEDFRQSIRAFNAGDSAEAARLAGAAEVTRRTLLGERDREWIQAAQWLAELQLRRDEPGPALDRLRKVLRVRRTMLGSNNPITGRTLDAMMLALDRLGALAAGSGDLPAAGAAYRELEELARERHGPNHFRTADARRALAGLDRLAPLDADQRRRLAEAERLMGEADRLADAGKPQEAAAVITRVMATRRELLSTGHPAFALSAHRLARLYRSIGNPALGEQILRQIEPAAAAAVGAGHPRHVEMLADLGELYVELNE